MYLHPERLRLVSATRHAYAANRFTRSRWFLEGSLWFALRSHMPHRWAANAATSRYMLSLPSRMCNSLLPYLGKGSGDVVQRQSADIGEICRV